MSISPRQRSCRESSSDVPPALRRKDTREIPDGAFCLQSRAELCRHKAAPKSEQVLLFGLGRLKRSPDARQNEFPRSRYQSWCWLSLLRVVNRWHLPTGAVVLMRFKRTGANAAPAKQEPLAFDSYGTKRKRLKLFRMSPASSRFTSFRRVSSRQSTRQTSLRTTTKISSQGEAQEQFQRGFAGTIRLHGLRLRTDVFRESAHRGSISRSISGVVGDVHGLIFQSTL